MRLKLLMIGMVVCLASAGTYAAVPFVAAWQIREAVSSAITPPSRGRSIGQLFASR